MPPGGDTHFRIASITKTMTSAVIVLLAQEGKLQFSDPVSKYVPNVPNGENITIAELLKMRSGLYGYTNDPGFATTLDEDPTKAISPQEVLAIAFRHPPEFPPGTAYDYSNTNYILLGLIAEKVDGKPLAQDFQDRLYGPLGLKQTLLPGIEDTAIPDPFAPASAAAPLAADHHPVGLNVATGVATGNPHHLTAGKPPRAARRPRAAGPLPQGGRCLR